MVCADKTTVTLRAFCSGRGLSGEIHHHMFLDTRYNINKCKPPENMTSSFNAYTPWVLY